MSPGNRWVDRIVEQAQLDELRQRQVTDQWAHDVRTRQDDHDLSVEEILRRMRAGEPMPPPLTPEQRVERIRRDAVGVTCVWMAVRGVALLLLMCAVHEYRAPHVLTACAGLSFANVGWGYWRIRRLLAKPPADPAPTVGPTYRG